MHSGGTSSNSVCIGLRLLVGLLPCFPCFAVFLLPGKRKCEVLDETSQWVSRLCLRKFGFSAGNRICACFYSSMFTCVGEPLNKSLCVCSIKISMNMIACLLASNLNHVVGVVVDRCVCCHFGSGYVWFIACVCAQGFWACALQSRPVWQMRER